MNGIIVAAALAVIFACGYGAQSLLAGSARSFNLAEQIALSWLLGVGIISMLIWIFGFFAQGALLPSAVLIAALFIALIGWRRSHSVFPHRFNAAEIVLSLLIAAQVAIILYLACVHTLGWDGVFNWEIKARYAFVNGGVLPASYLHDEGRRFTHQEYPLCIPFTELWLYLWLGAPNQFWAKMIFPIFYGVGAMLLAVFVARLTGRRWIGMMAALLLFFVPQITVGGGSAIVGYADFPLSVLYLATVGFLVRAAEKNDASCFRAYAACLALLPWVKREGVVLWAVAAACGAFVILRTKRSGRDFRLLLPGLLLIAAWHFYLGAMHASASTEFLPVNVDTLCSHFYRVRPIAAAVAAEFRNLSTWSFLWLVVALGSAHLLYHRRRRELRVAILLCALLAPLALYFPVYIFSNWPDYLAHLRLSVSRLLMHVAPVGLCIAALAAARLPQKTRRRVNAPSCTAADCERTAAVEFA